MADKLLSFLVEMLIGGKSAPAEEFHLSDNGDVKAVGEQFINPLIVG